MNTIHFIGYSAVHPSDFHFETTTAPGQYTLLLVSTPVQFLAGGQWLEYPEGTAMLYAPGQHICYRACGETYQNDWMRFTSDDPLVTQFPLPGIPFPVSDTAYCHNLIKLLTWEASLSSDDSDQIISNLLKALFLRLRQDTARRETSAHASRLLQLHKKIYNSPHLPWNIRSMADELHLSAGYLQILYKKTFGVSCMDDVIASRIRMAREQLAYTDKPVAEIADACGYRNVEHFCRQFRQQTGFTPGAFRRSVPSALPQNNVSAPGASLLHNASVPDASLLHNGMKHAKKETPPKASPEDASFLKHASPFSGMPHYNVAGSDLPSDVLDSEGNILPPHKPEF